MAASSIFAPGRCLAVVLGASAFPKTGQAGSKSLHAPSSFKRSSDALLSYLTGEKLGLSEKNVCNLFDNPGSSVDLCRAVEEFAGQRAAEASDAIVYYVGHGLLPTNDNGLFLAIRETDDQYVAASSLSVADLATSLKRSLRSHRLYVILDCCFSAAAFPGFLSSAFDPIATLSRQAFPRRGVALLCASSADANAWAPDNEPLTMFSGALLDVVGRGDKTWPRRLSLDFVRQQIANIIGARNPNRFSVPEMHQPVQREGSIADLPLFPNPARPTAAAKGLALDDETRLRLAIAERDSLAKQFTLLRQSIEHLPVPHEISDITCTLILQPDGSGKMVREYLGVTSRHAVTNLEIPYILTVSRGTLDQPVVEAFESSSLKATFVGEIENDRVTGQIRLEGELNPDTGFVGFKITQQLNEAFYMFRDEVERAYGKNQWVGEYFGFASTVPVRQLTIRVFFPPGFEAEIEPVVFFQTSETLDAGEEQRVDSEGQFVRGQGCTLTVPKPKRGSEYDIAWLPLRNRADEP
jgi:hypothetical protein